MNLLKEEHVHAPCLFPSSEEIAVSVQEDEADADNWLLPHAIYPHAHLPFPVSYHHSQGGADMQAQFL